MRIRPEASVAADSFVDEELTDDTDDLEVAKAVFGWIKNLVSR